MIVGKKLKCNFDLIPDRVPISGTASIIAFDFMTYCKNVPVKKVNLETFEELFKYLWTTFKQHSTNYQNIDLPSTFIWNPVESSKNKEDEERKKLLKK